MQWPQPESKEKHI